MFTLLLDSIRGLVKPAQADSGPFAPTLPVSGDRLPRANLIFRLKAWPQLPESGRTAEIYRVLSVMSNQPVNRQWLLARCRMAPHQLDKFLMHLVEEGALEIIDPARFVGRETRHV
jgi:hypothetical protein